MTEMTDELVDEELTGYVNARLDEDTERKLIALCNRNFRNRSDMTRMIIRQAFAQTFHQPETRDFEANGRYTADLR